ncbi:Calx-beta domain-containing protein [Planktothrix sp. FACHB-1365]|uniref:Calx-beta domain-containing protein n=1 Tax=Planktothrix sp. FACHB-1365 TaxID=2692855 RepID=UPI001683C9CE|nr:Calx-beta domain-containing protein [Planktothrix sp. FACHB-1365]MBD2484093.1 VCBS repeat-containing protein [Planktothrix sp. FACHB-1365]
MLLEFGSEQNNLLVDSSLKLTSSPATSPFGASQSPLIDTAIQQLELKLQQLAIDSELTDKMDQAFGNNWDIQKAQSLTQDWLTGEFKGIPDIKIVSQADIDGANGAFADAIDTIYLSREFLAQNTANPEAVVDILLEETGHFIDSVVNSTDTAGDEGERFATVVQGKTLTPTELAAIQTEDDTATVVIDGQTLVIEQAANTVSLTTPDASAAEILSGQTANPGRFTVTRTGSTTNALTVNYTVAGTATKGTDYSNLTGSVTIPIGATTANIPITVIDDTVFEGSETSVVTLSTSTAYDLGTAKTGTVTIADNDKPTVSLTTPDASAAEILSGQTANPGRFTVSRTGSTTNALTVNYTVAGTATKGTDYSNLTGSVTIPIGATTANIPITVIDDTAFEGSETAIVNLSTSTAYDLATAKTGTVTIADNDKTGKTNTDVDGDGRDDAIVSIDSGIVVRRSDGTKFLPNELWTDIGYWGTKGTGFADVTGDGKADAIASNDNGVFIRRSDGSKFLPNELWTDVGYWGTKGTWFADVTGDGKADAIAANDNGVFIRRSDGSKFLPNELWTDIGYWGTKGTWFADVTGDGKADAIASNDNGVFIRRSDGSKFLPNELWTDVGYWGTKGTWFADVTGDGKADAIAANDNGVYIRRSNGTGFLPNEKWTDIGYWGTKGTWFADVTGDGKADAIASNDNGVFIRRSDGSKFLSNEKWTDIGYWGTKGTWIGDVALSSGNPHLGYYSELSSFSGTQWDQQSGDNTQFEQYPYGGGGDQRWKTDDRIEQVYTDLSTAIFGSRLPMNAGYAYDSGYYSAYGSHSGIDINGSINTPVGAAVRGTVVSVEYYTGNGSWIAIDEIDSSNNKTGRRWWYGHLSSAVNVSKGNTVIPGQKLGTTNNLNHLHLSVINTYSQVTNWNEIANAKTGNYDQDVQTVLNRTMGPIQGYWKSKNGIKE